MNFCRIIIWQKLEYKLKNRIGLLFPVQRNGDFKLILKMTSVKIGQ